MKRLVLLDNRENSIMFRKRDGFAWTTVTSLGIYFILFLYFTTHAEATISENFCDSSTTYNIFKTSCINCWQNRRTRCPRGAKKVTRGAGTRGCTYEVQVGGSMQSSKGCTHTCRARVSETRCCDGYWGQDCQSCPRDSTGAVCGGKATCSDGVNGNGTCLCDDNMTGSLCEKCTNAHFYGANCQSVCACAHGVCNNGTSGTGACFCESGYGGRSCNQVLDVCSSLNCHDKASCLNITGTVGCVCNNGHTGDGVTCTEINPCETGTNSPCNENATCVHTGPNQSTCQCKEGFSGDGFWCQAIDPCQTDYGECLANSTICKYDGPAQSHCECKNGFENYIPGLGCQLIEICGKYEETTCDQDATCQTVVDGGAITVKCTCPPESLEFNRICYYDLMSELYKLNETSEYANRLNLAITFFQVTYEDVLFNPSRWTLFVPVDEAFPASMRDNISSNATWKVKARAHIVAGSLNVNFTENSAKTMYSILGYDYPISLLRPGQVADSSEDDDDEGYFADLKFGGKFTGKVLVDAKPAYNGMIYIIDTLFDPSDSANLISSTETLGTLKTFDSLSNFTELVMKSYSFQAKLMASPSYALFAPTNEAMAALSEDEMSHITSYLGRSSLEEFLAYNMVIKPVRRLQPGFSPQPVTDFRMLSILRKKVIRSTETISVNVSTIDGSVALGNEKAKILKSEIVIGGREVYLYIIDKVMIPESIKPLVKNRCQISADKNLRGPCGNCGQTLCPPGGKALSSDISEVLTCVYKAEVQMGDGPIRIGPKMGCNRLCLTVVTTTECCAGFYGTKCKSCPGPTHDACNSHGICSDQEVGTGLCGCNTNFTGDACDQCTDTRKYGPDCNQDCLCQHGTCKNTISSHGECLPGSCEEGWAGENCNREIELCANGTLACHQFAQCIVGDMGNSSCVCDPGYTGSGDDCVEFNPCQTGTCSINAFCVHFGGGKVACECMPNFKGDGKVCTPVDHCASEDRGQCSEFAVCIFAGPGKHHCECQPGYRGDGRICTEINICQQDNGGCHRRAQCTATGPGTRTCKCYDGYEGDGTMCVGNLLQEIALRSDLSQLENWITRWPSIKLLLMNLDSGFTCFLPDNSAWTSLSNDDNEFWINERHLPYLLKKHIATSRIPTSKLMTLKGKTIETLLTTVVINVNTVTVGTSDTNLDDHQLEQSNLPTLGKSLYAKLMVADLPVTNDGVIHIIDSVLLPPRDIVVDYPTLSTLMLNMEGTDLEPYSSFLNLLKSTKSVFSEIEAPHILPPYTLFMAPNTSPNFPLANLSMDGLKDLMGYHVINTGIIRASDISSGEHVNSLNGPGFKLTLVRRHGVILVNGQEVIGDGNRTANGIIYKLSEKFFTPVKTVCYTYSIEKVYSHCLPCYYPNNCPTGANLITKENCLFSRKIPGGAIKTSVGCQMRCSLKVAEPKCCPGFFGMGCDPCPGGIENVCFKFGTCSEGMKGDGTCTCSDSKYAGTACETCAEGRYGRTCDQQCRCVKGKCNEGVEGDGTCSCNIGYRGTLCDVPITQKNSCNGTCHDWANCVPELVGTGTRCVCSSGYSGDGTNCQSIKPCDNPNTAGCHNNAICVNTGPGKHNCTCKPMYAGDGRQCMPMNPCILGYGPNCDQNADCFMIAPNVSKCVCRENYKGDGKSCEQVNLCETSNGGCSENAQCTMTGLGVRECLCNDDYMGDGETCIGSIFSYISGRPEFQWFSLMDSFASLAPHILLQGGPIIAFLPSQSIMMALSNTLLTHEEPATQLYLNHIVGCADVRNLTGITRLRTLAGDVLNIAETDTGLKINGNISILMDEPLTFWNGLLYQIDAALVPTSIPRIMNKTTQPTKIIKILQPYLDSATNTSSPAYKNIKLLLDNGFQWFLTLLETAEDPDLLQYPLHNPWTLFLPTEDAFSALSNQRLRSFLDTENPTYASEYIRYHMVREAFIDPTTFMSSDQTLRTMQGSNVLLSCAESKDRIGDIVVNKGMATVIGFDVFHFTTSLNKQKAAAIYIVDKVLDPPSIGGRCDNVIDDEISKCSLCVATSLSCPENTYLVNQQECSLDLSSNGGDGTAVSLPGCEVTCSSYKIDHRCCDHHYGEDCHPCPGGAQSPCSGNGECAEGITANGMCTCKKGFIGTACERCDEARYGRNCLSCPCTTHGSCKDGINGDGTCYCDSEWTGPTCGEPRTDAEKCDPPCHSDGYCVKSGTCFCKPGYMGDGVESCDFLDMCRVNNGGCSLFATCSIVRGEVACKCSPNFVGDGYSCEGYDPCTTTTNSCHEQASCVYASANNSRCVCNTGYEGDGVKICTRKQPKSCSENKGGCSGHARCVDVPPKNSGDYPSVNCTCNVGYIGDGIVCHGTILQVITESLQMRNFLRLLRRVPAMHRIKLNSKLAKFTVFVPVGRWGVRGRVRKPTMLQRHIVQDKVHYYKDLQGMTGLIMQSGDMLPISKTSPDDLYINGVRIRRSDIVATNGVIHVIDSFITAKIVEITTPASTASTTSPGQKPPKSSKSPETTKAVSVLTPAVITVKPGGPIDQPVTANQHIRSSSSPSQIITKSTTKPFSPSSATQNSSKKSIADAVNRRRRSNGIKIGVAIGVIAIIMVAVGVIYWWKHRHTGGFIPFNEHVTASESPGEEDEFGGHSNPAYDSTGFNTTDNDDVILHDVDDETALALRGDERAISFENPTMN